MKNIFTERKKKEKYWELIDKAEKFEIAKVFTQVFGGDPDKELEDDILERLLRDEISIGAIDFIRKAVKEGKPVMMDAEFAD